MVCSQCNCSGHNKRTCQFLTTITPAEQRVVAELSALLPTPAEQRAVAELSAILTTQKVKKVSKPLEGLAGCANIFKEPKVVKVKKTTKTCSACGEKGHNSRTCQICLPCPSPKYYCFTGLSAKQAVTMARVMGCTPAIN